GRELIAPPRSLPPEKVLRQAASGAHEETPRAMPRTTRIPAASSATAFARIASSSVGASVVRRSPGRPHKSPPISSVAGDDPGRHALSSATRLLLEVCCTERVCPVTEPAHLDNPPSAQAAHGVPMLVDARLLHLPRR